MIMANYSLEEIKLAALDAMMEHSAMSITGIPFLFLEQNSPWFLVVVLAVVFWLIGLMIAYIKTESKYKK